MDETTRVIQITSPEAAQGKSTVVANLAVAFSRIGIETIVLDADLRRPRQHEIFGLDNSSGLSNTLALGHKPELKPAGEGLWVITSGPVPPDPTEMLHIRLPSVIKALRRRKALLLVDTPPVLPVSDARLVAPLTDGVILLATAGTQKPASFQAALDRLALVETRLLGMILNKAGEDDVDVGSYYRYEATRRPSGSRRRLEAERRSAARGPEPPPRRAADEEDPAEDGRPAGGAGLDGRAAARQPRGLPRGLRRSRCRSGTAPRCGRSTPLRASASSILLLLALLRAEALLLVLAAALPWEGLLAYPTESVSVVKILGVLLFAAWLVRALARSEPLRVSPALAWAAAARARRRALVAVRARSRPRACSTRSATRSSSRSSSSSCS